MVVSVNPMPEPEEFTSLLSNTMDLLQTEANNKPDYYKTLLGSKLEDVVSSLMAEEAKGTVFDGSIELISGQKFPDIVAKRYYGVEVKSTKQDHWTTTGNSVFEGTRIDNVERIYMLFGKMVDPISFKCRPYEECLSDVVVTHSPRYQINMDLELGETIFDKLSIPYDSFRVLSNPIKPIAEYYRKFLKPGDEVWWLDQDESRSNGIIIKLWNNLSAKEKKDYMIKAMILFPEIFSNRSDKFNRLAVWLVNREGIVCPNIRDNFTAGGQGQLTINGRTYYKIPKIIIKLIDSLPLIKSALNEMDEELILYYWQEPIKNKFSQLSEYISSNTEGMKLSFNLKELILSL